MMHSKPADMSTAQTPRPPRLVESYPAILYVSTGAALLGSFQFGYVVAVLNTALEYVKVDIGYANEAVISSTVVLGAAIGAICAGMLADAIGPKKAQLFNLVPFVSGSIISACTWAQPYGFLCGRLIAGFGAGAASLYAPRYVAEIAPRELRGSLVTQHQVAINVGILFAYMIGVPYDYGVGSISVLGWELTWWRLMLLLAVIPSIMQLVCLLICPESPLWLESRDKEAADESCIALWGSHAILYSELPDQEEEGQLAQGGLLAQDPLQVLLAGGSTADDGSIHEGKAQLEGWSALFRHEYRWMLMLALGLPLLQQACGINTMVLYSSEVFRAAGVSSPVLGSILMGLVNVLVTVVAGTLMDRLGRRPLMFVSYAGMAVCLFIVAVLNVLCDPQPSGSGDAPSAASPAVGALTAALVIAYVLFFALGAGPITWLYLSEILPKRIKGKAAALATFLCWMANLLVALTFMPLMHSLTIGGTFMIYALFNVLAAAFMHLTMVETKQSSLAQIEAMLLLPPKPNLRSLFQRPSIMTPSVSSSSLHDGLIAQGYTPSPAQQPWQQQHQQPQPWQTPQAQQPQLHRGSA